MSKIAGISTLVVVLLAVAFAVWYFYTVNTPETPVANNDQIVEGISAGVSVANDGVIAAIYALLNVVEEKDMSVVIGDNEIGHSYDRYKEKRGRQVSTGVFANAY